MTTTAQDALEELVREQKMRKRVYKGLVYAGKLTQEELERRARRLDKAIRIVAAEAEKERLL